MQTPAAWRNHITLLILMSIAMPLAFNTWSALLNNFAVEQAAFTGVEIGISLLFFFLLLDFVKVIALSPSKHRKFQRTFWTSTLRAIFSRW